MGGSTHPKHTYPPIHNLHTYPLIHNSHTYQSYHTTHSKLLSSNQISTPQSTHPHSMFWFIQPLSTLLSYHNAPHYFIQPTNLLTPILPPTLQRTSNSLSYPTTHTHLFLIQTLHTHSNQRGYSLHSHSHTPPKLSPPHPNSPALRAKCCHKTLVTGFIVRR